MRPRLHTAAQRLRTPPVLAWAACELLLVVWWLSVYPAVLSPDSAAYTQAITTGRWAASGSITYDTLEWLSLQATGSVALLVFMQLTSFAVALVLLARSLQRLGVPRRFAYAAPVVLCATPMMGAFASYMSKDMTFVIGQVLFTAGVVNRLANRRARTGLVATLVEPMLLVGAVTMTLSRHNGWLMLVVAAVAIALLARPLWRAAAAAAVVATAAWVGVTFVLAPAAGAHRADSSLALGPEYADISVVYGKAPQLFTARDRRLMAQVAPLTHWRRAANCYTSDILTGGPFDLVEANRLRTQLTHLWWRTLDRAPGMVIDARVCRGSIAWSITPAARHTIYPPISTPSNLYRLRSYIPDWAARGVLPDPPWAPLHSVGSFLMRATLSQSLEFVLWRGATWCYVAYVCVAVAARRRRSRALLATAAVVAANQLIVLIDNPNQLARYMMGCLVVGALLVPLLALPRRQPGNDDELVVREHATHGAWERE